MLDESKKNNYQQILKILESNSTRLVTTLREIDNENNKSRISCDMLDDSKFIFDDNKIERKALHGSILGVKFSDQELKFLETKLSQERLKNILSLIEFDEKSTRYNLGILTELQKAITYDKILENSIQSTSVLYSIILLLCIFSLQKTARKNSIVPS